MRGQLRIYFNFLVFIFFLFIEEMILKQVTFIECLLCARLSVYFKPVTLSVIGQ